MKTNKEVISGNIFWRLAERIGAQGVALIVEIILARILDPECYGAVALVLVITNILQVFVDSGLGNALIQKKNADDLDFSSVFWFNMAVCILLYLLMFLTAPLIAGFYHNDALTPIIRVLSLVLVISGLKNVQQAYISRRMMFKKFFFSTLAGTVVAAAAGITMAYCGCGVWALVAQNLINKTIDTMVLWFTAGWRPERKFSAERLKSLISYGWKLLASKLLDTIYNNIRQLLIGKIYSQADLAFYNKGKTFPNALVANLNSAVESVLFPAISKEQDDRERVKILTKKTVQVGGFLAAPFMMGMAFCSESIITVLLKEKWLPCVPFLVIFCISSMFYPMHTANMVAMKSIGRSDLLLKVEIIKKVIGFAIVLATMFISVKAIAVGVLISSVFELAVNSYPNGKLIGYGLPEQIRDFMPGVLLAVFMGLCVYTVKLLGLSPALTLLLQVPMGAAIYILGAKALRFEAFDFVLGLVKGYLKKE